MALRPISGLLPNDAPGRGVVAYVSGTAQAEGRAIIIDCATAGTATLTFPDASTMLLRLQANTLYSFNFQITTFTLGTAVASAFNIQ